MVEENFFSRFNRAPKLGQRQIDLVRNYFSQAEISTGFPNYLVIEPTNICNLKCVMCPRGEMSRPQGIMSYPLFKKIIDECVGKVDFIYLHFFGESLIHPQIVDLINYAGGKGMTIALSTNATLMNRELAEQLIASKLDLMIISIDSLNPETYAKIRGGSLETVLRNTDEFLDLWARSQSPLSVTLQMIDMNINRNEFETVKQRWAPRDGLNFVNKDLYDYAGQIRDFQDIGSPEVDEVPAGRRICIEPWRGMVIGWDGIVVPCCNDYDYKFILGNANNSSLEEIWNSDKMRQMRRCQKEGRQKEISLCTDCKIHHEDYLTAISHISSFNPSRKESMVYFDKGLWNIEISDEAENLWTRKRFDIHVQDKSGQIRIIMRNDNPRNEFVNLTIFLFGTQVQRKQIGRRTEICIRTPLMYKGRLLRLGFALENDWVPKDAGVNEDNRNLGVRIESIMN